MRAYRMRMTREEYEDYRTLAERRFEEGLIESRIKHEEWKEQFNRSLADWKEERREMEARVDRDRAATEARLATDRKDAAEKLAAERKDAADRFERERVEARQEFKTQRRWLIANFVAILIAIFGVFFAIGTAFIIFFLQL